MKKLKLTNKGKKLLGVLAAIASLLIIILIFLILSLGTDKSKTYDIEKLQTILVNEFEDLHLRNMDHIDLLNKFGINKEEIPNNLVLMSYVGDEQGNNIAEENYVIIINTEDYQYYYDMLSSQIDSVTRYTEDKEEFDLYSKAIIKCDENYVYMIISKEAKAIEKVLNE